MNSNLKFLALGIVGGLIPFGVSTLISNATSTNKSDSLFDGQVQMESIARPVSLTGMANSENLVSASESSLNSVVHVTTKVVKTTIQRDPFYEFFYGPGTGNREYKQYGSGSGSGVIISSEGYIVTNNHVIDGATEIEVILNDNSKYTASIVGADPSTDLAVLKIEAKGLKAIPIGNSDDIRVGEWVLAVGNPFNLTSTVTAGIVSAKARNINIIGDKSNKSNVPIESFIQTDAAVNPGNSGGALVNVAGELVGINTAIASQTGSYSGYSFAIPVNLMKKVTQDIVDFGIVQRGFLGVQISDISQELKTEKNLKSLKGIYIAKVNDNGGASKAGLKEGDVILKVGAKEVNTVAELQEEIGKRRPGDKVNLTISNSKGDQINKEVVLQNGDGDTKLLSKDVVSKTSAFGASFEELDSKEKKELNIASGVKIKSITTGKLKALGLTEGMIITKVDNQPVNKVEELTAKLNDRTKVGVLLEVVSKSGKVDFIGLGLR